MLNWIEKVICTIMRHPTHPFTNDQYGETIIYAWMCNCGKICIENTKEIDRVKRKSK